jgi:hypothetical protein
MPETVRISKEPKTLNDYMNRTDDLQLSVVPPAVDKKFKIWGWTQDESAQWTAFRTECNKLFADYSDPDKKGHALNLKMNELVSKVRKYDNDRADGHHLLDKVALNGTVDDCITCNVVRGTVLASPPVRHADDPTSFIPELRFKSYAPGQHVITVECSGASGKKLPEGMSFAQIYRCISATKPADLTHFELIGNAKRGIFKSNFPGVVPGKDEVLSAYYFGRYVSKKGELGNPGPVIDAPIMLAKP